MNLQENISRIKEVMGLNESNLPAEVRRRMRRYPEEKQVEMMKEWIMRLKSKRFDKNEIVSKAISILASELLDDSSITDEETKEKITKKLNNILREKHLEEMLQFYDYIFSQNDDEEIYCFFKHNLRDGGEGFADCTVGWYNFLTKYGYWLPFINWNEVKSKLKSLPPNVKLLVANPLEGHNYHYYFSVLRKK